MPHFNRFKRMQQVTGGRNIKFFIAFVLIVFSSFAHADLAVDELVFRTHYGATNNQFRNLGIVGELYSGGGIPTTGTFDVEIGIWDSQTGGNQLGSETFASVAVVAGEFSAHTPLSSAFDGINIRDTFISLSFDGTEVGRTSLNRANDNLLGGGLEVKRFATASTFLDYSPGGPTGTFDSGPGARTLKIGGRVTGAGEQLNNVVVRVHEGPTGGTILLEETFSTVDVTRGQFSLDVAELAGSVGDVLSQDSTSNKYVTLSIDGGSESQRMPLNELGGEFTSGGVSVSDLQVLSAYRGDYEPTPDSGRTWNVSGVAMTDVGLPLDGSFPVELSFYDAETAGTEFAAITIPSVSFDEGSFSIDPTDFDPIDADLDFSQIFVELEIDGMGFNERIAVNAPFSTLGTVIAIPEASVAAVWSLLCGGFLLRRRRGRKQTPPLLTSF